MSSMEVSKTPHSHIHLSDSHPHIEWKPVKSYPYLTISQSFSSYKDAFKIAQEINEIHSSIIPGCARVFKAPSATEEKKFHIVVPLTTEQQESPLSVPHPLHALNRRILKTDRVTASLKKKFEHAQMDVDSVWKISDLYEVKNKLPKLKTINKNGSSIVKTKYKKPIENEKSIKNTNIEIEITKGNKTETFSFIGMFSSQGSKSNENQKMNQEFSQAIIKKLKDSLNAQFLLKPEASASKTDKIIYNTLKQAFVGSFKEIYEKFPSNKNVRITVTVCLLFDNVLWTATSGPNKAIISQCKPWDKSNVEKSNVIALNQDKKLYPPVTPTYKRIELSSRKSNHPQRSIHNRGLTIQEFEHHLADNQNPSVKGFGYLGNSEGFNPRPEITKYTLETSEGRTFLIQASESLWNFFSSRQIAEEVQIMAEYGASHEEIAKHLTKMACVTENEEKISIAVTDLSFITNPKFELNKFPSLFEGWKLKPNTSLLSSPALSEGACKYLFDKLKIAFEKNTDTKSTKLDSSRIETKDWHRHQLEIHLNDLTPELKLQHSLKHIHEEAIYVLNRRTFSDENLVQDKLKRQFLIAQEFLKEEKEEFSFVKADSKAKKLSPVDTILEKKLEDNPYFDKAFIASIKGTHRPTLEDAHLATILKVNINGTETLVPLFGIFDGHAGATCSKYISEKLGPYLKAKIEEVFNAKPLSDLELFNLLKLTFVELGEEFREGNNDPAGSTATTALILGEHIWCFNVGDSRTVLSQGKEVIALSEDAKFKGKYLKNVKKRGGFVTQEIGNISRVNGLAMPSSVGEKKKPEINPRCKVIKYPLLELSSKDNYLILGCDGLFDVATSKQVAKVVRKSKLDNVANELVQKANNVGSTDNISALVVKFKNL